MAGKTCGCTTASCGCCEGVTQMTPMPVANRPGLNALSYRAGTHGAFLASMKARLSSMTVDAPGADGQTIETFQPLTGLTTRSSSDPAIALLDGWATVGDVLTFYQERIANEGFLRTAVERRSVLELARLTGYELRPGVASTVYLAYTLEDSQKEPVVIPSGAQSQSIPGPGELPQTFETSDSLPARTEWNNLQVRLTRPQQITFATALSIDAVYFAGTSTALKAGDLLLLRFKAGNQDLFAVRAVQSVDSDFLKNRTRARLKPLPPDIFIGLPFMLKAMADLVVIQNAKTEDDARRALQIAEKILRNLYLGSPTPAVTWGLRMDNLGDISSESETHEVIYEMQAAIVKAISEAKNNPPSPATTDLSAIVDYLLQPTVPQPAGSAQLNRNLVSAFKRSSDAVPQLMVKFAPRLAGTLYKAWSNARVSNTPPALQGIFALRVSAPLFGAGVARMVTFDKNVPKTPDKWDEWTLASDESQFTMFLDQAHEGILPDSFALVQQDRQSNFGLERSVLPVVEAQTLQRTAYGISGKTTQLAFPTQWRDEVGSLEPLRKVLVYAQSEPLELIEEPITTPVQGTSVTLDRVYDGLTSGRWVILTGERADIPAVQGVSVSELLMVSGLAQDYDPTLPGDTIHTTLHFATTTAYSYKRDTVKIYGNVAKATHGETKFETLGSGDGSVALPAFTLKQPPLTFVPAPTPSGADSTLHVYVNDVEWHQTDTLAGLGPKDRRFVTKTDDEGRTTVVFGNGEQGARLPTGVENVRSIYRSGIGEDGNVQAQQVSMLKTRPLGVKEVVNPLPASGGAGPEARDQARENAPLAVMSLDRLVSIVDYADFTRTFAGIGKASARRLSDGHRQLVHITIAGANDIPIDVTSDLFRNLLSALRRFGDPSLPVQVDIRELKALLLSAKVRLAPDYLWDPVAQRIRERLLAAFGFANRALGQPALLCEAVAAIQSVEGVAWVDVDAFGGIPEKTANPDGSRRLLKQEEIEAAAEKALGIETANKSYSPATGPQARVDANLADFEKGAIRPAQLAIFTPAVPDTIVLNQIL